MSSASPAIAAGSTMSAYFAVSVRKCSATTVNRSSRCSPFTILLVSGAWLTGLVQNTNRLFSGGSSFISPVSAAPSLRLLIARVPGLIQSPRDTFIQSTGNSQSGICNRPPPTCLQEPTRAGSAQTARIACPPPAWRSSATPKRITDGCAVANSRANCLISAALTPVIFSTYSGVNSAARAFNSAKP